MSSSARFDELKKKFDENPRRYFAPLANEFRKSGDAEQAVMICEEFLPQQPGHMSGHIVYGQALFDLGRLDDARTVFETALTLDPENLIALRHLGDIAQAHGDPESARQWYQRVLEADPRNEEVQALVVSLDSDTAAAPPQPEPAAPQYTAPPAESIVEQVPVVDLAPAFETPEAAPPPLPPSPAPPAESLLELDVIEEHVPESSGRTEGFEPMEFTPPSPAASSASVLDDQLEPGEFSAPPTSVAPLDGLEETAIGAFEARPAEVSPPPLPDFEPTSEPAASTSADQLPVDIPPEVIAAEAELIDAREELALPSVAPSVPESQAPAMSAPAEANAPAEDIPLPELDEFTEPATSAVPAEAAAAVEPPPRVTPSQPFVTETMAELYVKQGFRDQALDVYKLLLAASPDSQHLRDRVAELQPRAEEDAGPNVREFFSRIATRRPGDRGAATEPPASDDFAALDAFETVPSTQGASPAPPAAESPRTAPELEGLPMLDEGPSEGSIDALFGQRSVDQADASAASALAQAFGSGTPEPPPITGRPARAAAGELSLDSVFRDGGARPPRSAQSFSFDQFFSESASADAPAEPGTTPTPSQGTGAQAEPAERSSDDIEQFNSWLQGLKQR